MIVLLWTFICSEILFTVNTLFCQFFKEMKVFYFPYLVKKTFKALICFGNYGNNVCEVFTGSSNHGIYPSKYSHTFSGLAYYNGLPTTVGGGYPEANRKVETLSLSGWTTLPDHPK